MNTLQDLYNRHNGKVSDKWSLYISEYDRLLADYRNRPISLLEIGIQNGGSLEIWAEYFHQVTSLIGCDINPDCNQLIYKNPKISVVVGDSSRQETLNQIFGISKNFDIVIDDGSHRSKDIVHAFASLFPNINLGGIFIAEDLHCSYWEEFEGGLYDRNSSISFFKSLADIVNYQHWGVSQSRTQFLKQFCSKYSIEFDEHDLSQIHSVEFINSICVVRKKSSSECELGQRFIAGQEEIVVQGHAKAHLTGYEIRNETSNPLSQEAIADASYVDTLLKELQVKTDKIHQLDDEIQHLKQTIRKNRVSKVIKQVFKKSFSDSK